MALELAGDPNPRAALERACGELREARPTAVNLSWAVDRVRAATLAAEPGHEAETALAEARAIHAEETAASDAMAAHGADLLAGSRRLLTHCNAGALAAPGRGTASRWWPSSRPAAGSTGCWPVRRGRCCRALV